jgi:hypothetical protein
MDVMGGLVTKGLGGPACCTLTVGLSQLKLECNATPLRQTIQYDGGSRPYAPGEIANLYKPVTSNLQPLNKDALSLWRPYNPPVPLDKITVKVVFKKDKIADMGEDLSEFEQVDNVYTREFMIPRSRTKIITKANNLMNVSYKSIRVTANNLRSLATKIKVTITRFRKK